MSIEDICHARNIEEVLHFTRACNLPSIIEYGLRSRDWLDENDIIYEFNDELRLDGYNESLSLSITFPNYRLFYRFRQENDCNWIVIFLDSRLLWQKDCLYCPTNAANAAILRQNRELLEGDEAFLRMFEEETDNRDGLPDNLTTDAQAEVLCLEPIEPEFIRKIVFDSVQSRNELMDVLGNIPSIVVSPTRGPFSSREYYLNGLA